MRLNDHLTVSKVPHGVVLSVSEPTITLTLTELETVYRHALNAAHIQRYAADSDIEKNWTE
jgi:hypothetical protein